jgi:hypothetical protein
MKIEKSYGFLSITSACSTDLTFIIAGHAEPGLNMLKSLGDIYG